ncbi:hypothetical protein RclHR1_00880002 [Rhizophagus clarus]|uniref:Plasma membrane fusion protein PRM1 n=1 Tax=Rhizophagus clarus TaxID=94130 RepID=A0A2Z6S1V2_9GLOM|nr:hypothetical protein RclHR1_00880002 [Rhizophagus clarus]GES85344.1 hypothetical protein RCL_jg7295.t1 [Rhizophagus clarus]
MPLRTIIPLPVKKKSSPGATRQLEEGLEKEVASPQLPPNNNKKNDNIKPYIGLRSKLSLSWVNYTIIAFIFIILRLFIAMKSIDPIVEEVKEKAFRSCGALEVASSTVTSLPHFMAGGFNRVTNDGVNLTIQGAARLIDLLLVAMEGIIVWLIHVYTRTYQCLLEFAIRGSVGALSASIQAIGDATRGQLNGIKSQFDSQISNIANQLNDINSKIPPGLKLPTLTISTDPLSNFQLPTTDITNNLNTLNENIPSTSDIESKISGLISIPFEDLRGTVSSIMSNVRFNESALPVPPKNQVSFCAESLDLSVLDNIAHDLIKAARIGIGIMFIIALLMIMGNALVIWFTHIRYKLHINRTTKTAKLINIQSDKESVIEIIKIAEHPLIMRWIIKGSQLFKNPENRNLFRWFWDYILHKPALICLFIGLCGIIGIYLQIAVLNVVKHNYKQPITDAVANFGNSVENLINSQLSSTSTKFASDSNNIIGSLENDLNQDLLSWVNTTTSTLNNTLNTAVDEITTFVQTTFQNVPVLLTVVQNLVNCLILTKVEGIQKGLTFIQDNAHIGLPRVNDSILLLSKDNMNDVVGQVTTNLVGSPSENADNSEIGGEIGKIFDTYENNLRAELPLFYVLTSIWFVVILMGIIRVLWFIYQRSKRNRSMIQNGIIPHNSISPSAPAPVPVPAPSPAPVPSLSLSPAPPAPASAPAPASIQPSNDLSQFSNSIKEDDENKFNNFRTKMNALKSNRSSQKNIANPTFPRSYSPPQSNDNNNPFTNGQYRVKPALPPKPLPKPLPLKRHDIRENNPYNNY